MEMHIIEREKISYIRGKKDPPGESEDGYEKWQAENKKVKRWLLMSMSSDIMKRYLRLSTARDIWSALAKAFSDDSDELQVFSLNQKAFTAKQNRRPLSVYYGELTEIFQELDHRDKIIMKHPDDVNAHKKSIDRLRVHIFLADLDGDFEQICKEILRRDSIPDVEECYSIVRREAMRQTAFNSANHEASALVNKNRPNYPKAENILDKSSLKCTHCQKINHTRNKCFELVGYPNWWDHNRSKKNQKGSSTAAVVASKAEDAITKQALALVISSNNGGHHY